MDPMTRLLRILLSVAFVATGWISAPASAGPCCPCEPAPACCPLSAPGSHALPVQATQAAATRQAEPRCWQVPAEAQSAPVEPISIETVRPERPARAWLRVWRI